MFHPLAKVAEINVVLKRYLNEFGIAFLDPAPEFERHMVKTSTLRSELSIPDDNHPTAKGNLLLAESLAEVLKTDDQSSK